jgi:hypothetical protein
MTAGHPAEVSRYSSRVSGFRDLSPEDRLIKLTETRPLIVKLVATPSGISNVPTTFSIIPFANCGVSAPCPRNGSKAD